MVIQNTSKEQSGMCVGCQSSSVSFSKLNKNFKINIFQGTTGTNP